MLIITSGLRLFTKYHHHQKTDGKLKRKKEKRRGFKAQCEPFKTL